MQEDVFNRSDAFEARLREMGPFDVVMSDMAPRTTGTKFTDQARSLELACEALEVARLHLASVGAHLSKLTKAQAEYIGVPVEGPYKAEHYRY